MTDTPSSSPSRANPTTRGAQTDPADPNAPPRTVCVYCGASTGVRPQYRAAATRLGELLGRNGIDLVYGGGLRGLMGATADAALAAGARVTGIIPGHMKSLEVDHPGLTELIVVDSMHARKQLMVDRSDAFVVLPGGIGTLDETFEILSWKQLGLHDKPIIIVNIDGFWDPLLTLLDRVRDLGFVRQDTRSLFTQVTDVEAIVPALRGAHYVETTADTQWI